MNFLKSLIGTSSQEDPVEISSDNLTLTENGAWSYDSTDSALLDLSFKMVRGLTVENLEPMLYASWKESELLTTKLIFHCRDCRGGKGERQIFRDCLIWLAKNKPFVIRKNLHLIPFYGRWDDLFVLLPYRDLWNLTWRFIKKQLSADLISESPSILAKWMPRQNGSLDKKTQIVTKLCLKFKWTPRQYRQCISKLTRKLDVPEQKMCAGDWTNINYAGVPSQCMLRMRKAFARHDENGFTEFLKRVLNGSITINAKQLDVHQMVCSLLKSNVENNPVIEAQWAEKMKDINQVDNCLAVVDVSASMAGVPMQVAIAMGLVISEKASEPFKDMLITFHTSPEFHLVKGDNLYKRLHSVKKMDWGGSTDLQSVFDLILKQAQSFGLADEDLPRTLYIFSDMQFNQIETCDRRHHAKPTNLDMIRIKYRKAGYTMPTIVFWNLRANTVDFPSINDNGVVMLSGYNTSLLDFILMNKHPIEVLHNILNSDRYAPISLKA